MLCVGQAEVDSGWGRAPVDLGEFVVGPGEADLESFDFAEPAFAFGGGDIVTVALFGSKGHTRFDVVSPETGEDPQLLALELQAEAFAQHARGAAS